ncbi:MAG: glycosyltransferase family 39 protein [Planctomycetes bacterium]|nr:glycosyltransferase family 39 protein [Planctomycetota bacterium]
MITRSKALVLVLAAAAAMVGLHVWRLPSVPYSLCFHDELHYAQQARDVAAGGFPRYTRAWEVKYPPLYGLVIAPARALFGRDGFARAARVLNALLLASALVPAYCLARRELARGRAVLAAVLCLLLPFQAYPRYLLSENLLIPLFLWFVLAAVRLFERPSIERALAAGLGFGLVFLTKSFGVVVLPALVLGVGWAWRSLRTAAAAAFWAAIGAGALVVPWVCRRWIFPSEADVKPLYSYFREFAHAGLQELSHYLYWLRAETGLFVVALGTPALVLGLYGLLRRTRDSRPARRGLAALLLATVVASYLLVATWQGQVFFYAAKFIERYLVFLWPCFVLVFVVETARPRLQRGPLGLALAVFLLLLLAMPDAYFRKDSPYINMFDFPSAQQTFALAAAFGSPLGIRLFYLAPLVLLPALFCGRRWAAIALIVIFAGLQVRAVLIADQQLGVAHRVVAEEIGPIRDWLAGFLAPGDALIHHAVPGFVIYQNTLYFELDYCRVDDDFKPDWQSPLAFDPVRGRFAFTGRPVRGTPYLLTTMAGAPPPGGERTFGPYRLVNVTDGLRPLGSWLDPESQGGARVEGVHVDGWCAERVAARFRVAYPERWRLAISVLHPADSPVAGPITVRLHGPYGAVGEQRLARGETATLGWSGILWTPVLELAICADRAATLGHRTVAFRVVGVRLERDKHEEPAEP